MNDASIHILGWVLIAAIWAFVLVGGWHTIRELRMVLRQRAQARPARRFPMHANTLATRRSEIIS